VFVVFVAAAALLLPAVVLFLIFPVKVSLGSDVDL